MADSRGKFNKYFGLFASEFTAEKAAELGDDMNIYQEDLKGWIEDGYTHLQAKKRCMENYECWQKHWRDIDEDADVYYDGTIIFKPEDELDLDSVYEAAGSQSE